ncbi:AI-2E family transporter [Crenalkalicoccus roseus]|uniref:AI-2E family transporter n=1 Tax=Crenalkalicoccus roseus TaxID=1485588 RepID=UPI001081C43D|nr:AI-2E family transporter [Crenalkalicoccus roseus]
MPAFQDPPRRTLSSAPGTGLLYLQTGIIIIAVLYFARDLLIPLALAVLLSFVLAPVVRALRHLAVPRAPAVLLSAVLALTMVAGVTALMGQQLTSLAQNLPVYQANINRKLTGLQAPGGLVERMNSAIEELGRSIRPETPPPGAAGAAPRRAATDQPQPIPVVVTPPEPTPLQTLRVVVEPLLGPLAVTGIILILVIFILLYREDLRDRLIRLFGTRDLHRTMAAMDDAAYRLSRYFLALVAMNTAYGLVITAALWLIGIPNPLLWGFIAGLMRFVPFIGSWIAVAFPALMAVAADPGWSALLWVLALYAVGELSMGQIVEPLVFGQSTGLSPIAVIAAATFWAWLWGPLGLLLAVPLTVCLVVLGRHVDQLEFLDVLLGDRPPLDPQQFFYQRAMAGDVDALAEQAERFLKEGTLVGYLDTVALPALRLAQADAARDALTPQRLEAIQRSVTTLLEDLEDAEETAPEEAEPPPAPPPSWAVPGAVQCLPGRGAFDGLLAAMLAQALLRRGFGVQQGGFAAATWHSDRVAMAGEPISASPRLVCLCLIEGGVSAATARYLLRRTRRRLRGVPVLALAWQAEEGGSLAAALRAEEGGTPFSLAASVAEAVAMAHGRAATEAEAPAQAPAQTPSLDEIHSGTATEAEAPAQAPAQTPSLDEIHSGTATEAEAPAQAPAQTPSLDEIHSGTATEAEAPAQAPAQTPSLDEIHSGTATEAEAPAQAPAQTPSLDEIHSGTATEAEAPAQAPAQTPSLDEIHSGTATEAEAPAQAPAQTPSLDEIHSGTATEAEAPAQAPAAAPTAPAATA